MVTLFWTTERDKKGMIFLCENMLRFMIKQKPIIFPLKQIIIVNKRLPDGVWTLTDV